MAQLGNLFDDMTICVEVKQRAFYQLIRQKV